SDGNADGVPGTSDEEDSKQALTDQPAELKPADELKAQEAPAEEAEQGKAVSKPAEVDSNSSQPESAQEKPQAEGEKEQEQPAAVANTEAAKSTQGNLQALLANLTLDSMKALHDEVEAGLAAANAVLSDPKATQAQVDEQTRAMEALISRVNQALTPALENPTILEKAGLASTDLTSTGITSTGLATPDGAVTEQPTGGKRRRGGGLSATAPAATQDASSAGGNATTPGASSSSQATPQALPTYTNTEGKNGVYDLKKELEFITNQLRANNASEDKIQAAKAAVDKFNEAFSKGDTISQSDFDAALADLKKSRELIEGVLAEKEANGAVVSNPLEPRVSKRNESGYSLDDDEDDIEHEQSSDTEPTTIQPRSNRTPRSVDSVGIYNNKNRYYFDRGQDPASPYSRYTYAFFNERAVRGSGNPDRISRLQGYLKETVTPTTEGFRWNIEINPGRNDLDGISFMFTVPNGQNIKQDTVTVTKTDNAGTTSNSTQGRGNNQDMVTGSLSAAGANSVVKGTPENTNAAGVGTPGSPNYYLVGNVDEFYRSGLAIRNTQPDAFHSRGDSETVPANSELQSRAERELGNQKLQRIKDSRGVTYYGRIAGNTSYTITFKTQGNNDLNKLDYLSVLKGIKNGEKTYLGSIVHVRTDSEKGFADKNIYRLQGNGYYEVEQNTAYYTSRYLGEGIKVKEKNGSAAYAYERYEDKPLDPNVKGVLTNGGLEGSDKAFDIDGQSYGDYYNEGDQKIDKETAKNNVLNNGQIIRWYKGDSELTKEQVTLDAISTAGVHTYKYKVSYNDGSSNEGEIHFVTKPKKPEITTDIETKLGQTHDVTVRNIEPHSEVTLYRKGVNNQADSLIGTVTANGQGNQVTFSRVNLQAGTYYVKQKVGGSWLNRQNSSIEGVYSDPSSDKKVDGLRVGTTGFFGSGDRIDRKPIGEYLVKDNPRDAELLHAFIAESPDGIKNVDVENPDNLPGFTKNQPSNASSATRKGINVRVPARNIQGSYKLIFKATSNSGVTKTFTTVINYPPAAPSFETTSENLKGKAQENLKTTQPPIVINVKSVSVSNGRVQDGKKWKVFLVRGGRNNDDYPSKAVDYEIIAETNPRDGDGRAEFTPDTFKVDKLGTHPLRLITALIDEKTGKIDENLVSTLSTDSIQATNPITKHQIKPEVSQDPDTLEVTAKVGQGGANRARVTYFPPGVFGANETFTKVGNSWVKDSQNNNNITISNNSDGTGTIHIPYGTSIKNYPVGVSQREEGQSLDSDNNNVIVKGDETAPKVSLGDTVLPTTANDATTPIYKVVQGSAFAPKLKIWDNIGSVKELNITDIPAGITKQNFGDQFQSQTNAKENSKYSGSTFSGNVADTQEVGQHTAQITVKDASNNTATYYLRYEILPKVEVKQAKFPQVKSKALQNGDNPETYIQFKSNNQNVTKPAADVAWESQPNTAVEGLDKTGVVKVTYHVTDENGQPRDEVKNVTINTPVYHATVNGNGIYETTVGTNFSASTSATGKYLTSNFNTNVKYYWKSNRENGYSEYGGDTRSQTADYLGKRTDTIRVFYPNSNDRQDFQDKRSEDHVITFVSKPKVPSVDATSLAGKANKTSQTVTVNNVTPGTTVKLYNGDIEIGSVNVPKVNNESYTAVKNNVTVTVNGRLPLSDNIRAKTIYMPNDKDQKVESDFSAGVSSTTQAPSKPSISQSPEDLVVKAKVGQDGATKVTLTYVNANGVTKTVRFTKNNGNWDKDNANADATVSITNETDGLGEIQLQQDTAQAGSEVTVKQKTDTSDYSPSITIKALSRLDGITNVAQADGSVDIRVPEDATRMSLTYTPTGQTTSTTLEYTKNGRTWTSHNGINTYSDERKISIPKGTVEDGTTVSVIASNDSKTTTNVKSKAKFEQPSATTSATRQNGDVEVTLPTNAEEVTLNYKNKENVMSTVTVSKRQGNTWTVGNLPDGVSFSDGKVTFDYRKVNRDTPITTSATRGTGEEKSQQSTQTVTIPEHVAPRATNVVIPANGTPSNEQLSAGVEANNKRTVVAKEQQTAVAAGTKKVVKTTLTYQDNSTEEVDVTVISRPLAPSVDNLETRSSVSGLLSTARTISGQAMAGAEKVKLTLQDGNEKEINVSSDGRWTYTLTSTELLTQTTSRFNAKYSDRQISVVQVKNGVDSEPTRVGVLMGRATVDTPLQAGRTITVHIPHDTTGGYIRIGGSVRNGGVDIGLKKVGDNWTLETDTATTNKLELTAEVDPDNQAMTKVTLKVKDNSIYNSPFTIGSEQGAVKFRAHFYNGGAINQPIDVNRQAELNWILSETPTNTRPTIKLTKEAGTETPKLKDNHVFASPTVDELKGYFEGSDVEDDNGLTVGYAASNTGKLRVRVFKDRDTSANRQGTSVSAVNNRIPAGNYTLVLSTVDAAGEESNVIEKNIVVKTMADFYRGLLKYPTEAEKATFGNDDLEGDNFKQEAKTRFADKVREANQGNAKLPADVTYTTGADNEKARTVVANFPDGSTIDISHALVAKPTKPTINPTEGQGESAKLSDTDRTISGTALLSATKVTIHFQDGRGERGSQDVTPVNGKWSYNLPANRYLRQTDDTSVIGSSSVPLSVTQTVFDAVSDKENIYVAKQRNFEGRTITQPKGSEELKALKTDARKGIKYTEKNIEKEFPSDFDATWLQTPNIDTVGKGTYKVQVTEKEQSDTSRPGEYDVTIIVTNPKPVELTYENKDNGTTRIKLPTDADKVRLTIPKGNRIEEYTLTSENNWALPSNSGITREGDYLVLNSNSVDGNRQVTAIATKGEGELKSQETPTSILIPTHDVQVSKITKKAGESTANEELFAAIDVDNKDSVSLKQGTNYPTTVGTYNLEVVVTYADRSTEIVRVPYEVTAVDKSGLTTAKDELAAAIAANADKVDKPQSKVTAYETAKQDAETAKQDAETVIGDGNATAEQVRTALNKVEAAKTKLENATTALNNAATTPAKDKLSKEAAALDNRADTTNKTPNSVTAYNNKVAEAQNDITQAKAAAQAVAEKGDNATATEVSDAQAKVTAAQEKLDEAKKLLVAVENKSGLTTAKDELDTEVNKVVDTEGKTPASVAEYNAAKQAAQAASAAAQKVLDNQNATEQEIQAEITKVNAAKDKLTAAANGLKPAATAQAKQGLEAPVSTDGMTPDNSGNTPVPGVTTDDSSNIIPATPSSTVGQAQASTPAQETPVSTNTPNNSGNTVTPSETRPVDKSELARLVEELETRLKDLDGIDSTTLESAKALLTEIKQALNDESLTGFDLRDIVRRMREVIDSLKGVKEDQQNQEKDQMKYDSQTTTEFSYVVMLGSLIALLGLLLFLIARRKKESELKKLLKELSKLEAELDSTSVDAKVLDQAREALAQAVAFLANEKESDHTEDELIEKLKAILAQLR
uniref:Rib/alpha-like domain-containing protein n=2 Tax=unclassified Streptococcus TaxID=2608887 RepID=UPI0015639109